jgi:hypothetical protein
MNAVEAFGRLCLLTTFMWSAIPKIRNFTAFRQHVATTIPGLAFAAGPLAVAVLAAELCTGVLLVVHSLGAVGLAAATLLLTAFTVYLLAMMRYKPGTSCGCVGVNGSAVSGAHVVRNLILLAACGVTWWANMNSATTSVSDYVVAAGPATVAAIAVLHLGELAAFFRPAATN